MNPYSPQNPRLSRHLVGFGPRQRWAGPPAPHPRSQIRLVLPAEQYKTTRETSGFRRGDRQIGKEGGSYLLTLRHLHTTIAGGLRRPRSRGGSGRAGHAREGEGKGEREEQILRRLERRVGDSSVSLSLYLVSVKVREDGVRLEAVRWESYG